jgi:RNA polymerase sigma-70 factor (ECF subfamily)
MEVGARDPAGKIEAVYRRRYGEFFRVAVAILRDEQLAEEAVHEAFVRALRHRRGFAQRGSLEAWLWRIVVNEARRHRVVETKMPVLPLAADQEDTVTTNGHGEHTVLSVAVASLPERQRLALFLRYYADLDYRRIAKILRIEVGTVSATLHAAHASLRRALNEVSR